MTDLLALLSSAVAELDPFRTLGIFVVIFGAAIVKGAIGFGFPLLATPLISTLWDARHAVLLLSLASLFNNVGVALRGGGSRRTFRRIAPTIGGLVVGVVGGALLLANLDPAMLGIMVGGAAIVFAAVALLKPGLGVPPGFERYGALPLGLLGGLLGGSTGIFAPVLASYVFALQLPKRELVFFLTLMYLIGGVVQVTTYVQLGLYDPTVLLVALVSCVPNVFGISIGFRIQDRIDPKLFRRLVVMVIGLAGTSLVLRGLWH